MRGWLLAALLLAPPALVRAADVVASAPRAISVTVYRDPDRSRGAIDLDRLGGFALVTETRQVRLPAGESRLRFEGVVDGIQPASAIVTGLPGGVIEKNRDAALLSPLALLQAAQGAQVTLARTNPKTGKVTRIAATIRSAGPEGVVFQTDQGIEALRCSGLPETFRFDRVPAGLVSTPTLSVLTRTARPVTATVTLSYLAEGFDWAASYVATLNPDGRTLDLAGWITLANGNGVSLPAARTQIVAGRLDRARGFVAPPKDGRVIARCWPSGTTSDIPPPDQVDLVHPYDDGISVNEVIVTARKVSRVMPAMMVPAPAPPPPPPPEQLGDLKLYRVPQPTTVAARQSKQVRLLDQAAVPFTRVASADLYVLAQQSPIPASVLLRTKNDKLDNLGLPLPAGQAALLQAGPRGPLRLAQVPLRDTAEGEDVELNLGTSPDVLVRQTRLPAVPGAPKDQAVEQVDITSARPVATAFELRLRTFGALRVERADPPMALKDGRPIFRLTVPANGSVSVRYVVATR